VGTGARARDGGQGTAGSLRGSLDRVDRAAVVRKRRPAVHAGLFCCSQRLRLTGYFRFFAAFRAVFFRPPLRADFFLAPFFRVAMGSSPLKEFGADRSPGGPAAMWASTNGACRTLERPRRRGRCIHRRRVSTKRERSSTPMRRASHVARHARASRRVALGAHVVHRRPPRLRCYQCTTACTTHAARELSLTRTHAM